MTEFAFTVPGRPRGKGRHRTTKSGHAFTPKATRAAEKEIATLAMIARPPGPLMTGTVELSIEAVFRIPKSWPNVLRTDALGGRIEYTGKPDRDNLVKLYMDALNGVAWIDDAQVNRGAIVRRYGEPERVEVKVRELQSATGVKSPAERRREAKLASGMVGAKPAKRRAATRSSACEELAIGKRIR
jgi:Holliday junction resolvase RusA-like endonuclease